MTLPTNGITPEIIRDIMPPYHLSQDLLAATLLTIPPPPPEATAAWRQARLTRLIEEITAYHPADAAQARIAAQILVFRELADSITARAHTGAPALEDLCRIARSTSELQRSATALERILARHQQKPVPFFGTVIQDAVDIKTLDAQWARRSQSAADLEPPPGPAPRRTREASADTKPPSLKPTDTAPTPRSAATVPPQPTPIPPHQAAADTSAPTAIPPAAPRPLPETAAHPAAEAAPLTRPAAPGSDWTITRLDEGPGWSREVLRHRAATAQDAE